MRLASLYRGAPRLIDVLLPSGEALIVATCSTKSSRDSPLLGMQQANDLCPAAVTASFQSKKKKHKWHRSHYQA